MQNLFPIILKQGHVFVLSKNKQMLHYSINDNQNLPKEIIELDFVDKKKLTFRHPFED